jgi:IclR family KDG regulon transcriptional repressor
MAAKKSKLIDKTSEKPISAAVRTIAVLEALSEGGFFSFDSLSERVGLAKPTLFRFLKTLKSLGYVLQNEDGKYSLSLKMLNIGSKALESMDLHEVSRSTIKHLSTHFKETVHLAIMVDEKVAYIQKVESKYTIRMYSTIGKQAPLYCTSLGKALLAWSPDRQEIIQRINLVPYTKNTIVSKKSLETELAITRERGYAIDAEEHEADIHCIGAPIFDYSGAPIAAISVAWPIFRYDSGKEAQNARVIIEAANEISQLIGNERK